MSKKEEGTLADITMEVNITVLIKFISRFDGTREKLNPFLNNCRSAIELSSPSQTPILFKYILSQLDGKAEIACSLKEFESFDQFEEFLQNLYGDRKHYAYLLSELQECKQGQRETVNQFALRIESCLSKLLSEINLTVPTSKKKTEKKGELAGRAAAMEDLALHTFVTGLHHSLSTIVRCREPETLGEAISYACEEEKISLSLRKQSYNMTPSYQPRENARFQNREFQNRPHPSNFQGPRPTNRSDIICRYCKNVGHSIENCRKRQYNNNRRYQNQNNQSGFSNNLNHQRDINHTSFYDPQPFHTSDTNPSGENLNA